MSDHDPTPGSPEQRADELRSLAGPVSGWDDKADRPGDAAGSTAVTDTTPGDTTPDDSVPDGDTPHDDETPPADNPDALHDPDVDDVRAAEQGDEDVPGAVEDPYELRSMPVEPNPREDDPGSYLNT